MEQNIRKEPVHTKTQSQLKEIKENFLRKQLKIYKS